MAPRKPKAAPLAVVPAPETEQTPQQIQLVPDAPPVTELRKVRISDIDTGRPVHPSAELCRSIRKWGMLQPVALEEQPEGGKYRIVEGRRRIAAAAEAGDQMVPALVFDAGKVPSEVGTIMAHATRKANLSVEVDAVMELISQNASPKDIARATGLRMGQIKSRIKLAALHQELRVGLALGTVKGSVAELAAKLPAAAQERLAGILRERGKLKATDVRKQRTALAQQAAAALPGDLFKRPEDVDTRAPWLVALDELVTVVRQTATHLHGAAEVPAVVKEKLDMLRLDAHMLGKLAADEARRV
jgi:ParB/RepB/Spo0J family partition protein